jgi:cytochrome P450
LSNLYAALCWSLINIKRHPDTQRRLEAELATTKDQFGARFFESQEALDSMRFCEQLLMESVRLAQRSITLRKVMKEIEFDCGNAVYTIQPGVYITTMLSVTNVQTPELTRFDPDHYQGRKIDPDLVAQGKEAISTFGHGKHACPAQKFSHNMCKVLLSLLFEQFEFSSIDAVVEPSSSQMGGVSRAAEDVILNYARKREA